MDNTKVTWMIISIALVCAQQQDLFHQPTDEPVFKDPIDNKGVVIIAVCSTLGFLILMIVLLLCHRRIKRYFKKRPAQGTEEIFYLQQIDSEAGTVTPLMDNSSQLNSDTASTNLETVGKCKDEVNQEGRNMDHRV